MGKNLVAAGVAPRAKAWRSIEGCRLSQTQRAAQSRQRSTTTPPPRRHQPTDLYPAILSVLSFSSTIPSLHPSATKSATSLNHHNRLNSPGHTIYFRVHEIHVRMRIEVPEFSCLGQGLPCHLHLNSVAKIQHGLARPRWIDHVSHSWDYFPRQFSFHSSPAPLTWLLPTNWGDLEARPRPTSGAVTMWDDFCQSTCLLAILIAIVTPVCVFAVSEAHLTIDPYIPACSRLQHALDTQRQQQRCMQPTVPASLRLDMHLPAVHRLPFCFVWWGIPVSPPPFCPRPQTWAVAQFTVMPTSPPRDFPVSLCWLQRSPQDKQSLC